MPNDKRKKSPVRNDDVMHGRSLAGAEYGANELEQTRDRVRVGRDNTDEAGEIADSDVTDAEIEARERRANEEDGA